MSYTGTQQLNLLIRNIAGTYSGDELQTYIDQWGNVTLAHVAILRDEASKVMFSFSAGDTSVDKSKYAASLRSVANDIEASYLKTGCSEVSTVGAWSGSASFGSAEVVDFIDDDYNEADL